MACEPRFVVINGLRTLVNPLLLIEVMSPSSAEIYLDTGLVG